MALGRGATAMFGKRVCAKRPSAALLHPYWSATSGTQVRHISDPPQRRAFSAFPTQDRFRKLERFEHHALSTEDFVKEVRKPVGLYSAVYDVVRRELKATEDLSKFDTKLDALIGRDSQSALLDSLLCNLIFPKG